MPTAPPPAPSVAGEVALLVWPAHDDLRRWLAARRQPRMLLVAPDAPVPELLDDLEDWLREPAHPADVDARSAELARRGDAAARRRPVLDDDGLLRHRDRWVAIPDGQVDVVHLLLERLGRLVTTEALRAVYEATGGSGHPDSLRTLVARLNRRVGQVGLRLVTIRGRGVLLATAPSADR
jgi:DNA-binding response OmpR family regulator